MFSAMTVPRYSARSVAAIAISAASQYGIMRFLVFSEARSSCGRLFPVAIPSFPDMYWRTMAIALAIQTAQIRA